LILVIGHGAENPALGEIDAKDPSLVCLPSLPDDGNRCSLGEVMLTTVSCGKAELLKGTARGDNGVSDLKLDAAIPESLLPFRAGT